jgi:hypothetical protein
MTGDVNKAEEREVLLLLPNLVPHPVSFHITVLVFSKKEIAIILFFDAITTCSVILESVYYINNVKCYNYRCCLSSVCTNALGWIHIYCNSVSPQLHGLSMGKQVFSLLCDSQ